MVNDQLGPCIHKKVDNCVTVCKIRRHGFSMYMLACVYLVAGLYHKRKVVWLHESKTGDGLFIIG